MIELVKLIAENGIMIVLAGMFIYSSMITDRRTEEMLRQIQSGNNNIAKANENMAATLSIIKDNQRENLLIIKQIQGSITK